MKLDSIHNSCDVCIINIALARNLDIINVAVGDIWRLCHVDSCPSATGVYTVRVLWHSLSVHLCYLTFEATVSKQGYRQNIFFESDATLGNIDRDEDSDNDRDGDVDGDDGDQAVNFEW